MKFLSWKRKVVNGSADLLIKLSGVDHPSKAKAILLERINPLGEVNTKYGYLKFSCPNELIWWRVNTFHKKEPETLDWIDSMGKDDVLFDIGANIGLYSLYAAKRGLKVFSFEPEALNYAELTKNVFLNKLSNIKPINFALCSSEQFVSFKTSSSSAGTANQESDLTSADGKFEFTQTTFGTSLDSLLSKHSYPVPQYVKIDVDGPELDIVRGMVNTLRRPELKSVLIEIDERLEESKEILNLMMGAGFQIKLKTNFEYKVNNYIFSKA